jgi:ribonuclease HII
LLIAAASILAKTARDAYCDIMEERYKGYGFAKHKGYPTAAHIECLRKLGPCPEHRRSFSPVREALA